MGLQCYLVCWSMANNVLHDTLTPKITAFNFELPLKLYVMLSSTS